MKNKFMICGLAALVLCLSVLCLASAAPALELRVRNDFDRQLYVAAVYYDSGAGAWITKGWYATDAKSSKVINITVGKSDIYVYSELEGTGETWGKGDVTRVVISEAFQYRDGEECPAGTGRKSVKFTKFTAKNGVVNYRPVSEKGPLANAGGTTAKSPAAPAPSGGGAAGADYKAKAGALIELINYERQRAGVAALKTDEALMTAAARRASELAKNFSHTRPDGREYHTVFAEVGISPAASGENVAYREDDSALEMNEQFLASPSHKAAMLNAAYSSVGVGLRKEGKRYYWVELFTGENAQAPASGNSEKSLGESLKELENALKELGDIF
jgi:uncharacterized protein YkwD